MRAGERLVLPAPVSPRLHEAIPELQAIYAAFDPRAERIPVDAVARREPLPRDEHPATGLFVSLGVDSFYSLLKNARNHPADAKTVTHLISIHGFDIAHDGWEGPFPPTLPADFRHVA